MPPESEPTPASPPIPVSDREPITFLRITVEVDPTSLDRTQTNETLRLQSKSDAPPFAFGGPSSESIAKEVLKQLLAQMPEPVQAVKVTMGT